MYPHIRFYAYLVAKNAKYPTITNIPIPTPDTIRAIFPKISLSPQWLKKNGLYELHKKTPAAKIAYTIWANEATRQFLYIHALRGIDLEKIYQEHFRIQFNEDVQKILSHVFFAVSTYDLIDFSNYSKTLDGRDREVLELCLSNIETEVILSRLQITSKKIDHDEYLHNMFFKAYNKFLETEDIAWGKFAVQLEKRITESLNTSKRDILRELKIELDRLEAEEYHPPASEPLSIDDVF